MVPGIGAMVPGIGAKKSLSTSYIKSIFSEKIGAMVPGIGAMVPGIGAMVPGIDNYGRYVLLAEMLLSYLMLGFLASLFSSIFPRRSDSGG